MRNVHRSIDTYPWGLYSPVLDKHCTQLDIYWGMYKLWSLSGTNVRGKKTRFFQNFFQFVNAGLTYFLRWSIQRHHRRCLWFGLAHPSSSWSSPGSARGQPVPKSPTRREKSSNPLRLCYWTSTNQTSNNRTANNWMENNWTANNQWSTNWRVKKPKHEQTKGVNYKTANNKTAKTTEQRITKRQPSTATVPWTPSTIQIQIQILYWFRQHK
jgi:hypothetical protein